MSFPVFENELLLVGKIPIGMTNKSKERDSLTICNPTIDRIEKKN